MGFQAVIKSAASAASLGTQKNPNNPEKMLKSEGKIAFLSFCGGLCVWAPHHQVATLEKERPVARQGGKSSIPIVELQEPRSHRNRSRLIHDLLLAVFGRARGQIFEKIQKTVAFCLSLIHI